MSATTAVAAAPGANRWWVYQRERFPVVGHGLLIAAFSFSAVSYSWLLRGKQGLPPVAALVVAFLTSFLLFLQLRIADEFKDFDEDSRYRPYRPVPRGLVQLRELAVIAAAGAGLQFLFAWWLAPGLVLVLLPTWAYLALMTKEFFVREWIREKPVTYLWTHMLILPLTDFYATACDWRGAGVPAPPGLLWFIAVSFFNGVALELGRKIRAPGDEEEGVRTYSRLWGRRTATGVWLGALAVTAFCAVQAARRIGFALPVSLVLAVLLGVSLVLGVRFVRRPESGNAKLLEHFSGVWTLGMYQSLGAIPLLWQWLFR
jgi:4-hydroxybenzoate polyprenyltransferase